MIEPDLLYTVLCDEVRREDNGKIMLLGLFEQIGASGFPVRHPGCCVVNKWCNGQGSWTQQTRFVDEDDTILTSEQPVTFELQALEDHFTTIQMFVGLTLPRPGKVWVEILLNGELKQRYALRVQHIP